MGEVYTLQLMEILDREAYLFQTVDRERQEKASRYRRLEDRVRCLAAGFLMKHYLPDYAKERLRIAKDGKPYLLGGPAFSLSHGGDYVLLFVDDTAEGVGIDVEPIRQMDQYQRILPYYTTEEERQFIGSEAQRAVYIWTRKESLYKTFGQGISDFRELPGTLEDQIMLFGRSVSLKSWERDGHMFSIAIRGDGVSTDAVLRTVELM
jgi:phosphopantetheinyl transferase